MKILLVAINARFTHSSLAIRYLSNALRNALRNAMQNALYFAAEAEASKNNLSLEIILREYNISQSRLEVTRDIASIDADIIMASIYIWNAEFFSAIIPDIKVLQKECAIVLGGPEADSRPFYWLNNFPEVDLLVQGTAEGFANAFAKAGFRIQGFPERLLKTEAVPFASIPFPYTNEDFLVLDKQYLYYESGRGCPFSCTYCLSARADQKLDEKDTATVIAELEQIAMHEPFLVKFVDRSFNAHPVRAREILRYIITEHAEKRTRWHFELHPLLLEEEDFELLASAKEGLFQFELGVQTVNEAGRLAVKRGGSWKKEKEAIARLLSLKKAHIHLDLIAGLPGEDLKAIASSFDELMALEPDYIQLGFLKGLPSTPLRIQADMAVEENALSSRNWAIFQSRPPYEVLQTSTLSSAELDRLKAIEKLTDSLYNSGRFRSELKDAAAGFGGYFSVYNSLVEHCLSIGFDLRTKDRIKLKTMLVTAPELFRLYKDQI